MKSSLFAIGRKAKLPPDIEAIRSSAAFQNAMAELRQRVANTEPLSFALVDAPLPNGAVAIVRLNQPGPIRAYSIVNTAAFESRTYLHSLCAQAWYDRQRSTDLSPTAITVFADGRMEALSRDLGQFNGQIETAVLGPPNGEIETIDRPDNSGIGRRVLKRLKKAPAQDIPDFGPARLVEPAPPSFIQRLVSRLTA